MKGIFVQALALGILCSAPASVAQMQVGETVPDFTLKDRMGVTQNLYSHLNKGKSVIVDIFATWCGPCWSYHNKGAFKTYYAKFGPTGTNTAMAFMIEGDAGTADACLTGKTGCTGGSVGDWTTGVTYPIMNVPGTEARAWIKTYKVTGYPTILLVCPDKKVGYRGQATAAILEQKTAQVCGISPTSIASPLEGRISVHPTWSTGEIRISLGAADVAIAKVRIFDAAGATVWSQDFAGAGDAGLKADLSGRRDGIYLVRVETASGIVNRKIILRK